MKFNYILLLSLLVFASCNDDDVVIENPEELITTVELTLQAGTETAVFTFKDLDGDGGNSAEITNATLSANTTYSGSIVFLNESESPVEDITVEVEEEADEHQVFYTLDNVNGTVSYNDTDSGGNPLGLSITLTTGDASTGTLTVTLKHEPVKDATGVSDGDITNAGGETDVEATFQVVIQ